MGGLVCYICIVNEGDEMSIAKTPHNTRLDGYLDAIQRIKMKTPIISLQEAVQVIKKAFREIGRRGSLVELSKAMGNSPKSSDFSQKLSVLRKIGLLNASENRYSFTALAISIADPKNAEDEALAIINTMRNIPTLNDIYEKYEGKTIPQDDSITNGLDIPPSLKTDWANYFLDAVNFAGLIVRNPDGSCQLLSKPITMKSIQLPYDTSIGNTGFHTAIPTVSGEIAVVHVPAKLTKIEISAIRQALHFVDATLESWMNIPEKKDEKQQ